MEVMTPMKSPIEYRRRARQRSIGMRPPSRPEEPSPRPFHNHRYGPCSTYASRKRSREGEVYPHQQHWNRLPSYNRSLDWSPPPSKFYKQWGGTERGIRSERYRVDDWREECQRPYETRPNYETCWRGRENPPVVSPSGRRPSRRGAYLSHRPRRHRRQNFTRSVRPRPHTRRSDSGGRRPEPPWDEESGKSTARCSDDKHVTWYEGMRIRPHLRVLSKLGEGTFGRVLSCYDSKRRQVVAAKILRATSPCGEAAMYEAYILNDIQKRDPEGQSSIVRIYDSFELPSGHFCLVMEKLGMALYDFLMENSFRPFLMRDIQVITRDCLKALSFLHLVALTHTDLKPENILLTSNEFDYYDREVGAHSTTLTLIPRERAEQATPAELKSFFKRPRDAHVKLVDFGSAAYNDEDHSSLINTRQYRAPEVILDIGWDMSSDMWSLGCILVELYTGQLLFQTHEHFEHLAMMERIIGPIPSHMLKKAYDQNTQGAKYTNSRGVLAWPPASASESSVQLVASLDKLEDHIGNNYAEFLDLVKSLLRIDPATRPYPQQLMRHPFLLLEL
eukprot:Gregarina_sp_Poly_1__11218@NODE_921_length_5712_cov_124_647476_g654_i0_p1_GENE_NODE_921_length_5712_cov_124_647476_g654_i0NODE_921_length_5712_cov_124_647476_g654_i0_p1_ORF_typecomplete_len561_score42_62Pkinase/PF00069_25/2_8e52Pkinase_Tyr/PF07714_17/3_1e25Kinaselike/PF14531_6/0_28Kinaselike/PF14531_6/5_5e06Pkinase_fungal/PF17667_1/3_2e07Kdo/PF06293_14/0_0014Choline_kinase/PF01633_20/0_029_NODE_921_length_5712_cov_124_647476_g654_i01171799